MSVRSVHLRIGGQTVPIKTDASDERLAALVDLVESRITRVGGGPSAGSDARVLLLVALSLAEELSGERQRAASAADVVKARARQALEDLQGG